MSEATRCVHVQPAGAARQCRTRLPAAPRAAPLAKMLATALAATALAATLLPRAALAVDLKRPEVREFIAEVVARDHFKRRWVEKVLAAAESRPAVIEAMTRPAEHVRPWFEYRALFLTDKRIHEGAEFYGAHRALLEDVAGRSGVPGAIIAAIVGVETSYGRQTGRFRVLDALATLAFDYPPRAAYFRGELEQLLLLAREKGVDLRTATGSYAGAMGAPQFMPHSYRAFAVDGDGDGKVDLWNDWPDIVASVAHYLAANGWRRDEPVFAPAELWYPDVEGLASGKLELSCSVESLRRKGVEFTTPLPPEARALFVALRAADGPTYGVGFNNFWVITRYNRSSMYARVVSELADAIIGAVASGAATPPAPASPAPAPARPEAPAPAAAAMRGETPAPAPAGPAEPPAPDRAAEPAGASAPAAWLSP
jgi:membrane-bound lytic murein transglycosylase B